MRNRLSITASVLLLCFAVGCGHGRPRGEASEPVYSPRILESAPHDPEAFTQGLAIDGDFWLESTGLYGRSELREVDRATGEVLRRVRLAPRYFGEGLALHNGHLYQLTWKERTCFVYDRNSLERLDSHPYRGEGWGLASDGSSLYMSDGSAIIRIMDPASFEERSRLHVRSATGPVSGLNEMAWIDGEIWANVFPTKWIVRISPQDGRVRGFIDLHHLPLPEDVHPHQDVLNGIAYDKRTRSVWVTGKNWKRLYRLEWPPPDDN